MEINSENENEKKDACGGHPFFDFSKSPLKLDGWFVGA